MFLFYLESKLYENILLTKYNQITREKMKQEKAKQCETNLSADD